MKKIISILVITFGALHAAPLNVVVTIPDLADITKQVGGDQVDVFCIASGRENPHNVPLKPSAITRLAKADLLIQLGLGLEHAYAPALIKESRNPSIQVGASGFCDLSGGVKPLNIPASVDRKNGDVHPNGNPHYNTDPVYGQMIARGIAAKLGQLRPESAAVFKANGEQYAAMLQGKMAGWQSKLASKDISLVHGMIPLGSCTMKLNSTAEMIPITWPQINRIHPFAPLDQAKGYAELISSLENILCEVTGFPGMSLQPNCSAQRKYGRIFNA
jgi:ABC-type Zn uptake system ZnuABC Zn-binding protein ZnuA